MSGLALGTLALALAAGAKLSVTLLSWFILRSVPLSNAPSSVLLVIAHPDDESMFFAPTLLSLRKAGAQLHVLCLSNGNADGMGKVREKELEAACSVLQVAPAHVRVVNDHDLQDGMKNHWSPEAVERHVKQAVEASGAETVLTFDDGGVSGHMNHICTAKGVRLFMEMDAGRSTAKHFYSLVTTNLVCKYISLLHVPVSWLCLRSGQALYISPSPLQGIRAMMQHRSQLVWFRWLFVTFSSYTLVNTLEPMLGKTVAT